MFEVVWRETVREFPELGPPDDIILTRPSNIMKLMELAFDAGVRVAHLDTQAEPCSPPETHQVPCSPQ